VKLSATSARAGAILAASAAAAFAISTAAVSSATAHQAAIPEAAKFPFASFSFTGGVSTPQPAHPSVFALSFATTFTLSSNSPGIVNQTTGTLDNVTIAEQVSYPVPGTKFVGPVRLPFKAEKLVLTVAIKGSCFVPDKAGGYSFQGTLKCVTSTLTLGSKTYKASALLKSVSATFKPTAGAPQWTGSLQAGFINPGYTFPIATLGSGGSTTLTIGGNGGRLRTQSVTFSG